MGRIRRVSGLLALALVFIPVDALARQASSGDGVVQLVNWPDVVYEAQGAMDLPSVRAAEQYGDVEILPKVDTLSLWYSWDVVDGEPHIAFDLAWDQGWGGIVEGRVVRGGRLDRDIILDLVDLHADVLVDGERVGDLVLSLDSLGLLPRPDFYGFETVGVTWSDVFANVDSTAARDAFERGFTLENLDILRVGFEELPEPEGRDVPVEVRRRPVRRTIFVPDPDIWIIWDLGPDPYLPRPRDIARTWAPRGETSGRRSESSRRSRSRGETRSSGSERSGGRGIDIPSLGKDDDDDDDDDSQLLGPALMVLAGVGILVAAGGTVGVQGSGDSWIGLFSGAVRPKWAFLFHGSVNRDLFVKGDHEKLRVGMLWGFRPMAGALRPAVGAGVLLSERIDETEVDPTVDLGVIYARKELVLLGTVDALSGTPRIGIGVNFRHSD